MLKRMTKRLNGKKIITRTKVSLSGLATTETFTNQLIIDFIVFLGTTSLDSWYLMLLFFFFTIKLAYMQAYIIVQTTGTFQ